MNSIEIKVKTPIWTGDVDQKSELPQSSGIIGSLRWWAEAILRSMGKYACDPTDDGRCPKEERNRKYYCSACIIFGATGIRRVFRLNISGGKRAFVGGAINVKPSGRNRGWYLGSGVVGEINLGITSLDKDFDESLILLPLVLASNWGGIGAKTQHGYGVVEIEDCPEINFSRFKEAIEKITKKERLSKLKINLRHKSSNGLPNLKEMFFAKAQFEAEDEWWRNVDGICPRKQDNYRGYINDQRMTNWIRSGSVPIAPAIKNWLRYGNGRKLWETNNQNQNRRIENWLFGTTRNGKTASKINISCAYVIGDNLWEFRVWGWIPEDELPAGFNRNGFLDHLKHALEGSGSIILPWNKLLGNQTKSHKLKVWREFDSPRDTIKPNESNIDSYLQSLLNCEVEQNDL